MCPWPGTVRVDLSALSLTLNVGEQDEMFLSRMSLLLAEELKSYRDFDLHYTNELPLSSFIPIPEDKEVDVVDVSDRDRLLCFWCFERSSSLDITGVEKHSKEIFSSISVRSGIISRCCHEIRGATRHGSTCMFRATSLFWNETSLFVQPLLANYPGSGSFTIQEMISQLSPSSSQQRIFHHYHPVATLPPAPSQSTALPSSSSSFLNEQMFLSAAALAASHSYPPPSSFLSTLAASNLLSTINAHMHSIEPEQQVTGTALPTDYFFAPYEKKKVSETLSSPLDVKNLIGSSLTALGLDQVNEDEFDKAASNEATSEFLLIDNDAESFERSTTPATNNTSPTHIPTTSSASSMNPMTRPVNIPHSFTHEHFSHSSSAKSPFDAPNQLYDSTLESVSSTSPVRSAHAGRELTYAKD